MQEEICSMKEEKTLFCMLRNSCSCSCSIGAMLAPSDSDGELTIP